MRLKVVGGVTEEEGGMSAVVSFRKGQILTLP